MAKRGTMKYVPVVVIEEVGDIMREDDIIQSSEAFRKLVKYARVGREVNRMWRLDFSRKQKMPTLDTASNKFVKLREDYDYGF